MEWCKNKVTFVDDHTESVPIFWGRRTLVDHHQQTSHVMSLCCTTVFLKTPKFYWKISLLVRGIFKIQRLLLLRAIFTYMQKKWNCCDSVKELWISKGNTVQARALLHHLGSDVWKEGEGLLGHHPTVLLIPLPSTCCKNCPWVRKKIPFWSVFQLLSNHYQTLRDFSQWTGTPTSQHADRYMRNTPAQPQDGPSPNSSMPLLIFQTCFQLLPSYPFQTPQNHREAQQSTHVLVVRLLLTAKMSATPSPRLPHTYNPRLPWKAIEIEQLSLNLPSCGGDQVSSQAMQCLGSDHYRQFPHLLSVSVGSIGQIAQDFRPLWSHPIVMANVFRFYNFIYI